MKTKIINCFGGPGSGKSTVAAGVYYELKKRQINCELVREYVKKWAWAGVLPKPLDQLYITGKQSKAEHELYGKVEYLVTDCPLLMGVFYEQKYFNKDLAAPGVFSFLQSTSDEVERHNFMINRAKNYIQEGRYCSEEQAHQTDTEIMNFLLKKDFSFVGLQGPLDDQVKQVLTSIGVQ